MSSAPEQKRRGPDATNAKRQASLAERRRAAGLVPVTVWVPSGSQGKVRELAAELTAKPLQPLDG
jgi:hypothetical protein